MALPVQILNAVRASAALRVVGRVNFIAVPPQGDCVSPLPALQAALNDLHIHSQELGIELPHPTIQTDPAVAGLLLSPVAATLRIALRRMSRDNVRDSRAMRITHSTCLITRLAATRAGHALAALRRLATPKDCL